MNICFTGHRPNKLGGYDINSQKNLMVAKELINVLSNMITESEDEEFHFICGGAIGFDQIAFHICNYISKKSNKFKDKKFTTEIAVPFEKQYIKWNKKDVDFYLNQLNQADKITYVDKLEDYNKTTANQGDYHPYKMQLRNMYMVDKSDILIACWDGSKGGTYNCVEYASSLKKRIIRLNNIFD